MNKKQKIFRGVCIALIVVGIVGILGTAGQADVTDLSIASIIWRSCLSAVGIILGVAGINAQDKNLSARNNH